MFQDFKQISAKEWKLKIQADLKGADYQTLITHTYEGVDIKPFYHSDNVKDFDFYSNKRFDIAQELIVHNETIANKIADKALNKGADTFIFRFNKPFDIETLIDRLPIEKIIFKADMLHVDFLVELYAKTKEKAKIFIDPIGHFARIGNWYQNQEQDFVKVKELSDKFPNDYQFINVDVSNYKNAGANITQELAYALSQGIEYIENFGVNTVKQISFTFAIGNHYFFEIAKFQVFKSIWKSILDTYKTEANTLILATPSTRNKTIFDPYVNMLRSTMEMMSAILGGADIISNLSYDAIYKKNNAFSERIARNQLIILQKEAYFTEALNSFEGNYYLQTISRQLSDKVLQIFKQIEKSGGLLSQLYKGKIQEKIAESAQKEQKDFDEGKLILVGSNKYQNKTEKPENIEIYPFLKKRSGQTLIRPIIAIRLAEEIEKQRLKGLNIRF